MKIFVFFLSFVSAIGSFLTFGREYDVAYFSRSSQLNIFSTISGDSNFVQLPLSSRGMRELFTICADSQLGLLYKLQTSDVQRAVDANCAHTAANAIRRNPTYSAPHTIAMLSAQNVPQIAENLVLSHITAPTESWNAKLRLTKGLPLFGAGYGNVDAALGADITLLVQSSGGRTWLAALYKRDPSSRSILTKIIDERPFREKASFLNEVRKLG